MPRLAYFDCPTGVAGDMCLGALIHAGVPLAYLQSHLNRLGISQEFQFRVESVLRHGQAATKVQVEIPHDPEPGRIQAEENHPQLAIADAQQVHSQTHDHHHGSGEPSHTHATPPSRCWPEIAPLIRRAQLPKRVEAWSLATFKNLALAEAAVHGVSLEKVHFHEVGATDAIVDIVGTCLGLDWLGVETIHCSALPTGGGTVMTDHGRLPVPTPAVLKLWEQHQVPVYSNGINRELVTPTGAALMVTLASQFGGTPTFQIKTIGLGAGNRNLEIPNILRLWLGDPKEQEQSKVAPQETVAVLETQIDDLSPQAIAYTLEQLLDAGVADVFTQPIGMKKSRSGLLLSVICHPDQISMCEQILFRETSTLGIRRSLQTRSILYREIHTVSTPYGLVRIKVSGTGKLPEMATQIQPEYEDCARIAREHHQPWQEIHRLALNAWYSQPRNSSD